MNADVKREFDRMVRARNRLVDLRGERMEQLLNVRKMFRMQLADFFETLDPITNLRLAEVTADGSKSHGDLAIALSFFEGTKLRLAVDVTGAFTHAVSIPSAFDDVGQVLEIRVSEDLARAEVAYEPIDVPGTVRSLDLVAVAAGLLAHAVASVEAQIPVVPERAGVESVTTIGRSDIENAAPQPPPAARVAATLGGFSPRPASALRPAANLRREAAETNVPTVAVSNADILTLRLG